MARTAAARLAARLGIETHYQDQSGEPYAVPEQTLRVLWSTLVPGAAGQNLNAEEALARLDAVEAGCVEPVQVVTLGSRLVSPVRPGNARSLRWEVTEENGSVHRGEMAVEKMPMRRDGRRALQLPVMLSLGYHQLRISGQTDGVGRLIVAPRRAYQFEKPRAWGIATQLYSLRSARNHGIGDFGDLDVLLRGASAAGADAIGVNPLHALFPDEPGRASPYSPSSRLFLNPLYIDLDRIAQSPIGDVAALRETSLVRYAGVAEHKLRALEQSFAAMQGHLGADFSRFRQEGGEALWRFAVFQTLRETLSKQDPVKRSWRNWPEGYRQPDSEAVRTFAEAHADRIIFHLYLQWLADRQLRSVAEYAAEAGMAIGLYRDMAVGIDPDGADAWSQQPIAADGWAIGAPPDAWNRRGQDWGLLPQRPEGLRQQGYEPFSTMLRANMRHAGALRIDHVLGLQRLFWVPRGGAPVDGAYVRYPFDDLLRIVALESVRNRCTVIGEDLGTVPEGFSERLWRHGILSYRLQYFMQGESGSFTPPAEWPRDALASVSTHDLPTFVGYWTGRDIDLKQHLGLYPTPAQMEADRRQRATAREHLSETLTAERIDVDEQPPIAAVHRALARTPSRLVMVQIEDLLGLPDQMNLPGTVDEYPNWRHRLPLPVETLFDDPQVQRRLAPLREERAEALAAPIVSAAPRATYRLQLNREFTFAAATGVLPYLRELGVSHLYLSPIFEAQSGSTHGYDAVSFERINPELGPPGSFENFAETARELGLRLIVDFVPNHMGVGKARNAAWLDLLEWGQRSPHARTFDVDWSPPWPELRGKVLVPFLGDDYGKVLARGELTLRFDPESGGFDIWYFEHRFPINPRDYSAIVEDPELRALAGGRLDNREAGLKLKVAVAARARASPQLASRLETAAGRFRVGPDRPDAADRLHALLERQAYRLASWRSAASRINYRRFFDVSELAGIRVERPEVFSAVHRRIGEMIGKGLIQGLRIDHVDGLRDPAGYCRQLRRFIDRKRPDRRVPFFLVVEKILAGHERVREDWPVDGTTGYEFIDLINGLLVDGDGVTALGHVYEDFTGDRSRFGPTLLTIKSQVIEDLFASSLTALSVRLSRIAEQHWSSREFDADRLRGVLKTIVCCFPVYRTYVTDKGAGEADRRIIEWTLRQVRRRVADADAALLDFAQQVLTGTLADNPAYERREVAEFAMSFQQFTAPIMAKAFEDTLFYRFIRLLSVNEVGGNPGRPALSLAAFHRRAAENQSRWPRSMLATATHDTKRGEDARARLHVLSEMPGRWDEQIRRWSEANRAERISRADEYLIYQTLVGAWPMDWLDGPASPGALGVFAERIKQYLIKALREGKRTSSWLSPNHEYETACQDFVDRILAPESTFLESLRRFVGEVAPAGALNSLVQMSLKLTMPGVPDTYRGCELWDFSLVDPDNRRPIDFARRRSLLASFPKEAGVPPECLSNWQDGRIKLWLLRRLLSLREDHMELFHTGKYVPLAISGQAAAHAIAFILRGQGKLLIVVVGRHFMRLRNGMNGDLSIGAESWGDTIVQLPGNIGRIPLQNALIGNFVDSATLTLDNLLCDLPVALLTTGN